ncbi:MAG TPA: hypothetical protein PLV61_00145 [Parvularculaceae bacterium]|nr:hypothetical protein [Parvularculaceae bacterium]
MRHSRQRPVKVTAAIAETKSAKIEANYGRQHDVRQHGFSGARDRNIPDAPVKRLAWPPGFEHQRLISLLNDRKRNRIVSLRKTRHQVAKIGLAFERPAKTNRLTRCAAEQSFEILRDVPGKLRALTRRQILPGAD